MADWMKNSEQTDIQTAIQSQAIQTVLEKSTSGLTDAAFQSYLTNAPIPRAYYLGPASNTIANAANTYFQWAKAGSHDPYAMLSPLTTYFTTTANSCLIAPISGYYICSASIIGASAAAAGFPSFQMYLNGVLVSAGDFANVGTGFAGFVGWTGPMNAGDPIAFLMQNNTGGLFTSSNGHFSLTWVAPYNQYQGGQ